MMAKSAIDDQARTPDGNFFPFNLQFKWQFLKVSFRLRKLIVHALRACRLKSAWDCSQNCTCLYVPCEVNNQRATRKQPCERNEHGARHGHDILHDHHVGAPQEERQPQQHRSHKLRVLHRHRSMTDSQSAK
jgi:hypothetical protein